MGVKRFEDLDVWKAARVLVGMVYEITALPAFDRDRNLKYQLRDAATGSMANTAEGFESGSDPEFKRFLRISKRSAAEVQSHLYAALDHHHCGQADFQRAYDQAASVKRLAGGLIRYLLSHEATPSRKAAR